MKQSSNPFNITIFGFLLDNYNYDTVMLFIKMYNSYVNDEHQIDCEFIKIFLYKSIYLSTNALLNILLMMHNNILNEGNIVNSTIIRSINYIAKQECQPISGNISKLIMKLYKYYSFRDFFYSWFGEISIEYLLRMYNMDIIKYVFNTRKKEFMTNYNDILSVAILDRNLFITQYLLELPITFDYKTFLHDRDEYIMRTLCCERRNMNIKKCNMINFLISLDEDKYGKFNLSVKNNVILRTACMNNYKNIAIMILNQISHISSDALHMAIKLICDKRNNKLFNIMVQYDFIKKVLSNNSINSDLIHYADFKSCYKIKEYISSVPNLFI